MYDLLTSTALFILLVPGFLVTLPPTGGLTAIVVHAVVFYLIQSFLPPLVPSWAVLVTVAAIVAWRLWSARSATPTY